LILRKVRPPIKDKIFNTQIRGLSFERKILVRESSRTETTQLLLSNELCGELRNKRFDETAVSIGARIKSA